jgi:hypothetical protein
MEEIREGIANFLVLWRHMPEWISAGSGPEKTLVGFILCPILLRFG